MSREALIRRRHRIRKPQSKASVNFGVQIPLNGVNVRLINRNDIDTGFRRVDTSREVIQRDIKGVGEFHQSRDGNFRLIRFVILISPLSNARD